MKNNTVPVAVVALAVLTASCREPAPTDRTRVSGQVEATEVQVSAPVGGRLIELAAAEGQRVAVGERLASLDTLDAELSLARAVADRVQAEAQLRLLQAGARSEDIRQAEAQVASAMADRSAAEADLAAAEADVERFEGLLATASGSRKQRDDAVTRRDVSRERVRSAAQRGVGLQEAVKRLQAGARREELEVARTRVSSAAALVATLQKAIADAVIVAPVSGTITETLASVGEQLPPRTPLLVITDLDRAWANVYVDEPSVPRLRLGQAAQVFTDAGGPGVPGVLSFISEQAEFTPRNVQTAEDRSKLVYRVKVSVDNKAGILKSGMPVEAEIRFDQ